MGVVPSKIISKSRWISLEVIITIRSLLAISESVSLTIDLPLDVIRTGRAPNPGRFRT